MDNQIAKIRNSAYLQNTKLSNIVPKGKTPELYIFFMQKGKSAQNMILDIQNDDKYDKLSSLQIKCSIAIKPKHKVLRGMLMVKNQNVSV